MSSASVAYISASTNRHSHAASSSQQSIVAFGSSTYVALWNTEDEYSRGVTETLPGHHGLVTSVRFVQEDSFVSADDKGVLRVWRKSDKQWKCILSWPAHSKGISSLAVYDQFVATGASDSTVKIWRIESDSLKELQTISLNGRYPLSIDISRLPKSQALILAIGTTDRNIQVWTRSDDEFVPSATLAGHEDWIKSLAFRPLTSDDDSLVIASGSQDGTIRLWNIEPFVRQKIATTTSIEGELSDELLDAFEASLGDLADAEEGGRQISLKRHILTVKADPTSPQQYTITFDALLVGHEAGVTSLSWRPLSASHSEPTLLSTSADSSLILWSPSTVFGSSKDGATSLWINRQRFGDIGGQRLGGFVGGLWTRNGMEALAWGWNGGWRRWRCSSVPNVGATANPIEEWVEIGAISGHAGPIRGLSWSPNGEYLISASSDQTTRIHAPIPTGASNGSVVWHEIARPQVHGYDLVDVSFLDATHFMSIADEKVARVFEAPREFIEVVENLHIADLAVDKDERPRSAAVPPLGLSNKAITEAPSHNQDQELHISPDHIRRPPFEGELAAVTLWPEIEKVFGHGYESIALAVSNDRKLAATACKATSPEHAVVRVYDTDRWQLVGETLGGHSLTVTSIAFSPDDRFVLSVSRDRSWRLFERKGLNGGYVPVAADKSHARIIWDCAWACEGDIFATASRDKTVKVWNVKKHGLSEKWTADATIKLHETATAVAFSPTDEDNRRRLAVGLESGEIIIYSSPRETPSEWTEELKMDSAIAHVGHIYRLAWRPSESGTIKQLASCSEDGVLKVLLVHIAMV